MKSNNVGTNFPADTKNFEHKNPAPFNIVTVLENCEFFYLSNDSKETNYTLGKIPQNFRVKM